MNRQDKVKNSWFVLLGILLFCFSGSILAKNQADHIDLNFYQTDVKIILQALADHKQMNLVLTEDINSQLTIQLKGISWQQAFNIVLKMAKLVGKIEGNILIVESKPDNATLIQQKIQQETEAELALPLHYLILKINYADIQTLLTIIKQQSLLSKRGNVFIDTRSNTLVVYDIDKKLDNIASFVSSFDKPIPQVHIAAYIVTMSRESLSELGMKWGYKGKQSHVINRLDIDFGVTNATTSIGLSLAKHAGNLLNLELSALEAENQLEIIANPNLLTSHLHTASIKQGTEIPYEVSNGNDSTTIEFKQAVLGLEVTPRVMTNNQLELTLHITQNTAGQSIKRGNGGEALAIETQEIKTQVLVNNGETLMLGGILQQSKHNDTQSVPGLSQIPILGGLFKYQGNKQQQRELVIFITPTLVKG